MVKDRPYLRKAYLRDSLSRKRRRSRKRMRQITVRIEDQLYEELVRLVEENNFRTLSEAIRYIIRFYLQEVLRGPLNIYVNSSLF